MNLRTIFNEYLRGHNGLIKRADYIQTQLQHGWLKIYATESLISETWQLWNGTCQKILLASCRGCVGRHGNSYPARPCDNSLGRIAYEVKQYGNRWAVKAGKKVTYYWEYPTWGDASKIVSAITGLQPNNINNLVVAFGLPLFGHKHLQVLRNFAAHKNNGALQALKNLSCFTGQVPSTHPSCYVWEYCVSTNSFYYYEWLSDMKHIIYQATV